ncbi:hypothetical protein DPEC_G00325020 [Dallia pectoralis]|uniref:Uncharacterized protein n=1 Tax=Dallia pectoralis TaxID=75939 RepID=A0ACC2FB69_DALPE|nr:hypothetical protein DPEC_G00325020 [Dallia pectoralis]
MESNALGKFTVSERDRELRVRLGEEFQTGLCRCVSLCSVSACENRLEIILLTKAVWNVLDFELRSIAAQAFCTTWKPIGTESSVTRFETIPLSLTLPTDFSQQVCS